MIFIFFVVLFVPTPLFAEAISNEPDVLSDILLKFHDTASAWSSVIKGKALGLFRVLLIIDVAWMGIRMALKPANIKEIFVEFIKLLLFAGVMYALVVHYKEWATSIIVWLTDIAVETGAPNAEPVAIFGAAINLVTNVFDNISFGNISKSFGLIVSSIVICICFALIAAQIVLVKCESYIVLNAGMILLGFGGSQFTKDFATNFIRYALGVAVKLYIMQLLVALGMEFISDLTNSKSEMQDLLVVIGAAIVLLALVQSLPDIASGIINGSHVSTGQAINSAVTAVSTATMAAVSGGASAATNAASGVSTLREAAKYANAEGATGLGKARHMAGTIQGAVQATRTPSFAKSVASNVKAQHEMFKMDQAAQADAAAKTATPSDASGGME